MLNTPDEPDDPPPFRRSSVGASRGKKGAPMKRMPSMIALPPEEPRDSVSFAFEVLRLSLKRLEEQAVRQPFKKSELDEIGKFKAEWHSFLDREQRETKMEIEELKSSEPLEIESLGGEEPSHRPEPTVVIPWLTSGHTQNFDPQNFDLQRRSRVPAAAKSTHIEALLPEEPKCVEQRRPCLMMTSQSRERVAWDLIIMLLLVYVALFMPFTTGFGEVLDHATMDAFQTIDLVVNSFFILDVVLNFRTGYVEGKVEILDWRLVSKRYLRTWFLFDVLSSFPFELLTAGSLNTQALKIVKLAKVARVIKCLKPRSVTNSEFAEYLEDVIVKNHFQQISRNIGILCVMSVLCHWLACALKFSGDGFLQDYQDVAGDAGREYLASLYWSMTTLTTVGYGDITPQSDWERVYCMTAMVIGGAFYGYVIGKITSIVENRDLNKNAFYERYDLVQAWILHNDFPWRVRRKIRRHFKKFFSTKSAMTFADIFEELSPELRRLVGVYMVHDEVKTNALFTGFTISVLLQMQKILETIVVEKGSIITKVNETGTAMYIVATGNVRMETPTECGGLNIWWLACPESFGEEILFAMAELYCYATVAEDDSNLHMIPEEGFESCFRTFPHDYEEMRQRVPIIMQKRLQKARVTRKSNMSVSITDTPMPPTDSQKPLKWCVDEVDD